MIKKIWFIILFTGFLFAHTYPYCDFETSTPLQTESFQALLNNETNQVLQKMQQVQLKQQNLIKILNQKIIVLKKIRAILIQILLTKEKENFELEKIVKMSVFKIKDIK